MVEAKDIEGLERLNAALNALLSRAQNLKPVLQEIAVRQIGSFQQNFISGGRPVAWQKSNRVIKRGGQTLLLSGRLMKSITIPEVTDTTITFGSNLKYAAIHQFGGVIKRKPQRLLFRQQKDKVNQETGEVTKGRTVFASNKWAANKKTGSVSFRTTGEYQIPIVARPYIVFQEEDIVAATAILFPYLTGQE